MTILDTVRGTFNTAVDTISTVTQTLVEKNRTNAKLNRLRLIMKNESELMNRAYIALGKQFYENKTKGTQADEKQQEKLFEVIEKSKAKIAKARACYRDIVDSQNDVFYGTVSQPQVEYKADNLVDITVACSNENEYESSPFENVVEEAVEDAIKEEIAKTEPASQEDDDTESPEGELF